MSIQIQRLNETPFSDYASLTSCESGGGCYCSFWHQKFTSLEEWETCKKETPLINRQIVFEKMRSGFHVGVLAYQDNDLVAWLSVGPLIDFQWTWKRVVQLGEIAKSIAGITCFTVAPKFRGKGLQSKILMALKDYGKSQGWVSIEGYPFDESALERQKEHAIWPGLAKGFIGAGFSYHSPHWLNGPGWERSIYRADLSK